MNFLSFYVLKLIISPLSLLPSVQYNISSETYFDNFLLSSKEVLFDNLQLLRGPVDKTMWLNAPTAVNAYYDPQFNGFGKFTISSY